MHVKKQLHLYYSFLVLLLLAIPPQLTAQNLNSYGGHSHTDNDAALCQNLSHGSDAEAQRVIKKLCDKIGIYAHIEAVRCERVANCRAENIDGLPHIFFNPDFLNQAQTLDFSSSKLPTSTNWAILGVMAHEIGHLQNHHHARLRKNGESKKSLELEADEYSGCQLARMGATLPQAQKALYLPDVSDAGTYSHPARKDRLLAVEKGWRSCGGSSIVVVPPPTPSPIPTPTPRPKPDQPVPQGMVLVKGGTFTMGCTSEQGDDCDSDEKPAHQVSLSDFFISKYEVTNAEYAEFLNAKGNQTEGGKTWLDIESSSCDIEKQGSRYSAKSGYANHPVREVTWYGATAYAKWKGMRLPTEAEWEYAARGGQEMRSTKYAGSNDLDKVAWYSTTTGYSGTKEVGTKSSNELGLYDMSGNVWEWCSDWKGDYSSSSAHNPTGPSSGSYRVLRGGSWDSNPTRCRVAHRSSHFPTFSYYHVGFRLASSSNGSSSQF